MKMNDTLIIQDSIKLAGQAILKKGETVEITNWWFWISIIEFVIITFLILKLKLKLKESAKKRFKKESLKEEIDFDNIINSSFNSIQLFNELKTKCHPDRFPKDEEKNIIANNIFKEISKNKNNVRRLLEIKEEAIQKLNINF
jgi:hypothetical protein